MIDSVCKDYFDLGVKCLHLLGILIVYVCASRTSQADKFSIIWHTVCTVHAMYVFLDALTVSNRSVVAALFAKPG